MSGPTSNTSGTLVDPADDPADDSFSSNAPTPEDWLRPQQITSSAWEGWWWEGPLEETAT